MGRQTNFFFLIFKMRKYINRVIRGITMEAIETKVKKWGNSLAVILPNEITEKEHIKEKQNIKLLLIKDNRKVLKEIFGTLKLKRPTEEILRESDKEGWDE